jgi:DNA-directed RNA polymerase subunit M/transcription elongation factor TFIIS
MKHTILQTPCNCTDASSLTYLKTKKENSVFICRRCVSEVDNNIQLVAQIQSTRVLDSTVKILRWSGNTLSVCSQYINISISSLDM